MHITLIGGENWSEAEQILERKLKKYITQQQKVAKYYADELTSLNQIPQLTGAIGFFPESVVVIRNLFANNKLLAEVLELLKSEIGDIDLIIVEDSALDKRSKLYKQILKIGEVKESSVSTPQQIEKYITEKLKEKKLTTDTNIFQLLKERLLPLNLLSIDNELDKLSLLLNYEKRNNILKNDLEIINYDLAEEVWNLFELAVTNKPKAFDLLDNLIYHQNNFNLIIGFLVNQLRNILLFYYDPEKLSPFVYKKIQRITLRFDRKKLQLATNKLLDLDLALKTKPLEPYTGLLMYLCLL